MSRRKPSKQEVLHRVRQQSHHRLPRISSSESRLLKQIQQEPGTTLGFLTDAQKHRATRLQRKGRIVERAGHWYAIAT